MYDRSSSLTRKDFVKKIEESDTIHTFPLAASFVPSNQGYHLLSAHAPAKRPALPDPLLMSLNSAGGNTSQRLPYLLFALMSGFKEV